MSIWHLVAENHRAFVPATFLRKQWKSSYARDVLRSTGSFRRRSAAALSFLEMHRKAFLGPVLLKSTFGFYVTNFRWHLSERQMFNPPAGPTSPARFFACSEPSAMGLLREGGRKQACIPSASTVDERHVRDVLVESITLSSENESLKCVHGFDSESA